MRAPARRFAAAPAAAARKRPGADGEERRHRAGACRPAAAAARGLVGADVGRRALDARLAVEVASRRARRSRPPASIVGEPASSWKSSAAGAAKSGSASWLPPVVVVMPPGRDPRTPSSRRKFEKRDVERLSACALEVHLQVVGTAARDHVDRMGVHAEGRDADSAHHVVGDESHAARVARNRGHVRHAHGAVERVHRDAVGGLGVHDAVLQRPAAGHVRRHGARGRRAREHDEMVGDRRGRAVHEPGGVHHLARGLELQAREPCSARVLGEAEQDRRGAHDARPRLPALAVDVEVLPDVELSGEVVGARRHDDLVARPGHRLDVPA